MHGVRRILLPTDGSESARPAAREALRFARAFDADVLALYVVDSASFTTLPGEFEWETLRESLEEQGRTALASVSEAAAAAGVRAEVRVAEGHPSEEILRAAAEWSADLVVMGTHGRSGLAHLLLGSVAERVIRHASCPVLVVRAP